MRERTHHPEPLTASTVLCVCCLGLLLASYAAIGLGIVQILRVEIPAAARSLVVRF